MSYHISVLLQETVNFLNVKRGKSYIDATLGGGGHTQEIVKRGGRVLGIDADDDALAYVEEEVRNKNQEVRERIVLTRGNFKDIDRLAKEQGFERVSGIIFDLGISSHHVDTPERGFSFQKDGPLDMRMDRELGVKAADLVNVLNKSQLMELFTKFGEERFARAVAQGIITVRSKQPITTTTELAAIVNRVVPRSAKGMHPATRIFQALRIAVNDELTSIEVALPKAIALLERNGRLAVISFHSLEDRIVKNIFLSYAEKGVGRIVTKKPIIPTEEEQERNKRSRSAKLRVFEKV